jgi:DNA-binding LytR/AlgR family response regulator
VIFKLIHEKGSSGAAQPARDPRPPAGGEAPEPGTSGAPAVTSGARSRAFLIAYAGLALFTFIVCTVNIFTALQDRPGLHPIEPVIWEYTSCLATIALLPGVGLLAAWAPFQPARLGRFLLVHAPATVVYSLLHVGGFVLLRILAYASAGFRYDFGAGEIIYEYRKDALAYVIALTVFTFSARLAERRGLPASAPIAADEPCFDIQDGTRLIRAPVAEILAATSAGNYVEFRLADGRRPLMRATLAAVETQLKSHGFVRTHRSWLINPLRVRGLVAEGSGDYRIELDGGVEAPMSRRFPQALEALRAPTGAV